MNITIAGAGYVGLVAGACYASTGNTVTMVDPDERRYTMLTNGEVPIYEPGLQALLAENVAAGRIKFARDLSSAAEAEVIGIAVGTPPRADGSADLTFIEQVAEQIAENIKDYCVVVTKSTVPVGTHRIVTDIIGKNTDVEFDYVSNPEFLKEGSAISDFLHPERVIIGTESLRARRTMSHLYGPFMRRGSRILFMDPVSAEMTKYACNAMLAVRISFMNEMARLAEAAGADVKNIRLGMGSDGRIGRAFLFPGIGDGGSCFPKDVSALIHTGETSDTEMGVTRAAKSANDTQADFFFAKINKWFEGNLEGKKLAMWGLAFKPNTDDMREAPSLKLIRRLIESGASVAAYDPQAMEEAEKILGDTVSYHENAYATLPDADGLVICTEWMEFRTPDFKRIAKELKQPVIFDGRNIYEPEYVNGEGLDYISIGRPDATVDGAGE